MLYRVRPKPPPGFIQPCLPTRADKAPSSVNWIHEIKHDGFRMMVRRDAAGVRLLTRNGIEARGGRGLELSVVRDFETGGILI